MAIASVITTTVTTLTCDLCGAQADAGGFGVTLYEYERSGGRFDICEKCFAKPIAAMVAFLTARHEEQAAADRAHEAIKDGK